MSKTRQFKSYVTCSADDIKYLNRVDMKPIFAIISAFVLAFILVVSIVGTSQARPGSSKILEICEKQKEKIPADKLPSKVNLETCPIGERQIVDNGVETILPEPGKGIHAEVLYADGAEELVVARQKDGEIELSKVGDDTKEQSSGDAVSASYAVSGPNQCRATALTTSPGGRCTGA